MAENLYAVRNVTKVFGTGPGQVRALDGIDLDVVAGQRLGIVGESGSGKSTLVRLLAGLERPTSGSITFRGREITGLRERDLSFMRSEVQLVFQDPRSSLDPRMRVSQIVTEPLRAQRLRAYTAAPEARESRFADVMRAVGLDPEMGSRFPHEFSGGQRQRIAIARALAGSPTLLIADEPVSALDVSVRAHVLNLVSDLVRDFGLTLVFVSHDLAVVRHVCDTVIVIQSGRIVESGPSERVFSRPESDYTAALLASVPSIRFA